MFVETGGHIHSCPSGAICLWNRGRVHETVNNIRPLRGRRIEVGKFYKHSTPMEPFRCVAMKPFRRVAMKPFRRVAMKPFRRVAMKPFRRVAMKPFRRVAMEPFRRVAMEPFRRVAMEPFRRVAMELRRRSTHQWCSCRSAGSPLSGSISLRQINRPPIPSSARTIPWPTTKRTMLPRWAPPNPEPCTSSIIARVVLPQAAIIISFPLPIPHATAYA
jgi:hypothetical protein